MDEEELEQPKNKITLSSFFESIAAVEKVANNALSIANSNLNIIQEQKSLIDALSMSIEGLRSNIQEVNNYITIEKNEASDKLVETQDDKQKQMISERLQGLQGEKGERGEIGEKGAATQSESARLKSEQQEKKQLEEFVNEVIDKREEKKENERKDELREKEDAEQKKEQSEKLESKSEGGIKATRVDDELKNVGGGGSTGGQGGDEKKKGGLFSLLKNPFALGALGIGGIASLLQLPKMLTSMGGAALGDGRGVAGATGGVADFLTGGLFDFDGRSGGGALRKIFGGKKDSDKEEKELSKKGKVEETGTGKDKKDKKGMTPYDFVQEKGLKVTDVEDGFKRMVHVYNPDVQDKDGNYQGIKVSGTFKKKDQVSTEQFVNAHEGFEIEKLKKVAKDHRKKENKLMDFVKKGGVAGFLGRKLFGDKEGKDEDKEKKEKGILGGIKKTLGGIGDTIDNFDGTPGSRKTKDTKDTKEIEEEQVDEKKPKYYADYIKEGVIITEIGPNDFHFKYPDGRESIQTSSGSSNAPTVEERFDGLVDAKIRDKKEREQSDLEFGKKMHKSFPDTYNADGTRKESKIDKKFSELTNKKFSELTKKKKKGRGILGMVGGSIDALTGNLTDFDRKGGKTMGATRNVTGMVDFFTADMFDLDKRGKMDLFGMRKKMQDKKKKETFLDKSRVKNQINFGENLLNPFKNLEITTRDGKVVKKGEKGFEETLKQASEDFKKAEGEDFTSKIVNSVIESKQKGLNQENLKSLDTSSNPQIIMMPGANEESSKKNVITPNNSPQVDASELKSTSSSSSFVHTISNNVLASAKKNKNSPPQIATMLK